MKRIILICLLTLVFLVVETVNWICLLLDHLIFPRFKRIEIKPPLFIIGMPRSATTFCYSLLSADFENTTSMKLWEILFAPSIIQKKTVLAIKEIDIRINHAFSKVILTLERYLFQQNEAIHPISLFNYEEDDYLFLHVFSTLSYSFIFPQNKRFTLFRQFDEKITDRQKRFLMNYYQGCIKRHLFIYGIDKHYLSKSPSHTPKIKTLMLYFPDCHFIYMLRNPLQAIASTISLFKQFEKPFYLSVDQDFVVDQALLLADNWYKYALISCNSFIGKSVFIMHYNDLITKPFNAVHDLYSDFGLEMTQQFINKLMILELNSKQFKSKNQYSPEKFGLSKEAICDRYSFVYESYPEI